MPAETHTDSHPVPPNTPQRAFLIPQDLPGPSGGSLYNRHVLRIWDQEGLDVAEERLPGTWPHPNGAARQALAHVLRQYRQVLIDGIIASAAPVEIARAQAAGVQVAVLMHLPLPAETGLSSAEQHAAAASEQQALRRARIVVCTSQWARRDVLTRYPGLTTAVAAPGSEPAALSSGSRPPQLLVLGAVSPRKNPLMLLRALQPLRHLDWRLTIAGPDGPDPDYVSAVAAAAQDFGGRVQMPGPLTGAQLDRVWDAANLLVLPSRAETYGMVVTEAIARGVPALVGAGTGAEEALAAGHPSAGRWNAGQPTADNLAAGRPPADHAPAGHQPTADRPPTPAGTTADLPGQAVDPTDEAAWTQVLQHWLTDDDVRARWRAAAQDHRDRLPPWSQTANQLRHALGW